MGRTTGEGQLLRSARDARAMRLAAAALACGALLVQSTTAAAAAVTNPYGAGTTGYDVGYPNCTETPPGGFAIVGLGGGRPFTTNGCLGAEWKTAESFAIGGVTPSPALYFNTGYAGAYARDITVGCKTYEGPSVGGLSRHEASTLETAWEIGCSEAAYAGGVAAAGGYGPSMWWADIETGNSWSTNQTVNQFTVDGIAYEMESKGMGNGAAGAYSYPAAWTKLFGSGFTPSPGFSGDWGPDLSCGSAGFSGAAVWIVQGATSSGGVDTDTGCG